MRRITLHMFTPVSVRRARACANSPVVTRQFAEVMMKRLLLLGTIGLLAACAESPTTPASVSVSAAVGRGNSSNAKVCQKNGWTGLVTSSGASFASEEACVSYAATGGQLYKTQTISFTSTNPSPVTVGDPSYTPTATATSGLPVAITLDVTSSGCVLSSGVVSFASGGTCVINANQAGNSFWYPAPQQTQSITILAPVTPLACATSPVTPDGPNYSFTFTASGGVAPYTHHWTVSGSEAATFSGPTSTNVVSSDYFFGAEYYRLWGYYVSDNTGATAACHSPTPADIVS